MLGELLDGVISVFSPAQAAKRAHARNLYRQVSKRAYEAARVDRTTSSWNARAQSADSAMLGEAERVRDRVRDLIRNNAYARGALDAIVANVVGCGIIPRPALEDDGRNRMIADAWARWCEEADVTGRLHFYEMQALACRELAEAGECLVHYVGDNNQNRLTPFALELIEAERFATERDTALFRQPTSEGNEIRRGVELNRAGRPVAYHLYPYSPNGISNKFEQPVRITAKDIRHIYRQDRIGQTRGISWMAPAVLWLRDLGIYVENELQASAVSSCFGVVIKTVDSGDSFGSLNTPGDEDSTDSNDNRLERLQPGLITHLMPGEDISMINPTRPNANADPWIALILRSIAVAMGLSYELVSRDYSRTNYSSSRASSLEDRRRFRPVQKFLISQLCQPVYREFFRSCVLRGVEGFPTAMEYLDSPETWLKVNWRTPGWEWVDPLKEIQAAKLAVDELFSSRGDVIETAGGDLRETWEELAKEEQLKTQLKIKTASQAQMEADATAKEEAADAKDEEIASAAA